MSHNGNEPFLFDLHEHITFRQGEEIDDLYGISIQPDVNIIKESNYIQLRGVLMVSGDYQSLPREEPMYYVDDQEESENYVQQVKALDNGFTTFQYPIPVDITIPSNRVTQTGEPDVEIEYFDYELPEPKSLHVYAKIRLSQVEMQEESMNREDVEEEEQMNSDFELEEIPSYEDDEVDEAPAHEPPEKGREFWQKKESQSFSEFFNKKEEKAKQEAEENQEMMDEENENMEYEEPVQEVKKEKEKESPVQEVEDQPEEKEKSVQEVKDQKKEKPTQEQDEDDYDMKDDKDDDQSGEQKKKPFGLKYLSNFFRDDEEPEKVSVRMRFVQENETLDSIADAYQVSVSQLEHLNGLEDRADLKTGDVLYVPYKK
ncbi:LysM peptidoglycan-binding domain-containing protein [Aquisalibacillus elongatus]|uniref:Stage VI sporulation protein D n=1 Tax=Aquisalibacillus elongatus TaxID=485577 RepID=A0A3N5BCV6_9BACI|nr:LysM peptidoglycan-binding domain-containing protein [Aquisalibacillus elongatus]RPF55464.1 stage VI sporulation protein D [Aquisalibacillus elongatus]